MQKGRFFFIMLLFVTFFFVVPAQAIWVENGKAVCTAVEGQGDPLVVADGNGGSIVIWMDDRTSSITEIYAQRVDEYGRDMWASDGVRVYTGSSSAMTFYATGDGASGAMIAVLSVEDSLYVQHLYADGTTWSSPQGALVCNFVMPVFDPEYVSITQGGGGAIITWFDPRSFPDLNIYAQRVDAAGNIKWAVNGVPVTSAASFQLSPCCAQDQSGGAIIAWADDRSGNRDIYAQRIDSTGTVLWTIDGVPVCTETSTQQKPCIISDGAGGVIISWEDSRLSSYGDIFLQKLNSSGAAQWTANGVVATAALYSQTEARLVSDGDGGVILTWLDVRNTLSNTDIYAQRLDAAGNVLWETDGTAICTADNVQGYPGIAEDGDGGAVIVWNDNRYLNEDIYAQRIGPDGIVMWEENGDSVCTGFTGQRYSPTLAYAGRRGVVIAWGDGRNGETDINIYAQGVDLQGKWGYPSPVIHSVEDVPGDQGGYIDLFWYASLWEDPIYDEITHYTLWRAVEPQQALAAIEMGALLVEDRADPVPRGDSRLIRRVVTGSATYFWELVGTQQAYCFEAYSMTIPTLFDSTAVHHAYHYFQVLAHRSNHDYYYLSGVDSAYSVDNLAPGMPVGLAGEQAYAPEGLQLTWEQNGEDDLAGYNVYRGTDGGFVPGPLSRLATTSEPFLFDDEWRWDGVYWYKVAAIDVNGNEGGFATLSPGMITGEDIPLPEATFLAQNFPNPFNPMTTIGFGLKEKGHVSLTVYNAAGQLVATLVDETMTAGSHEAEWNGRADADRIAASGIYFYRLVADDFVRTRKMVLLR